MGGENDSGATERPEVADPAPTYVLSTFAKHVNETFQIHLDSGQSRSVKLIEASASPHSRAEDPKSFALVFHDAEASVSDHLPQSAYAFEHAALGTLQLFIVPIGPGSDGQGIHYEAVFANPD